MKFLSEEAFEEINGLNNKDTDVYCAGFYLGGATPYACYWKNYYVFSLESTSASRSYSISIYGDDVYAGGYYTSAGISPCFWKNSVRQDLPHTGTSEVKSIYIKSGLVYSAGYDTIGGNKKVCYWINDIQYILEISNEARSIFIEDDHTIHIAGAMFAPNLGFYWNTNIEKPKVFTFEINGLYISNSNVYLAEFNGNVYKNNTCLYNTGGNGNQSIFVYENDIYVLNQNNMSYFKNNIQYLIGATVNKIFIYDNIIYTAGDNGASACYWKNLLQISLQPLGTMSYAYDIKIVKKR